MGGPLIEIRITHPWELIQPTPEALRPRLLDWQVDAKGRHVAWRYRITRYAARLRRLHEKLFPSDSAVLESDG